MPNTLATRFQFLHSGVLLLLLLLANAPVHSLVWPEPKMTSINLNNPSLCTHEYCWYSQPGPLTIYEATLSGGQVAQNNCGPLGYSTTNTNLPQIPGFGPQITVTFDPPVTQLSFTVGSSIYNGQLTIQDDRGWSTSITPIAPSVGCFATTVTDPSVGPVSSITITSDAVPYFTFWVESLKYCAAYCQDPVVPIISFSFQAETNVMEPAPPGPVPDPQPVVFSVYDEFGNPLSGVKVVPRSTMDVATGAGHTHSGTVPQGTVWKFSGQTSISDNDGLVLTYNYTVPSVSGTQVITPACDYPANPVVICSGISFPIEVKVDGLEPIPPASTLYTLIEYLPGTSVGTNIGDNGNHDGWNHYLTPHASALLQLVAFNYAASFEVPSERIPEKIHVNDASLPWGGLFDYKGDFNKPHNRHRRGTVVDVRANGAPGAIPSQSAELQQQFVEAAADIGARAELEYKGTSNEHFHLLLMGEQE